MKKNDESVRVLAMLRYQADQYRAMGDGARSQQALAKIRQITNEMNADAVKN